MRCALDFDNEQTFSEQKLSAWAENQSLKEEPSYREVDIRDDEDAAYFDGFKAAMDVVKTELEDMQEDEEISEEAGDYLFAIMQGELAMRLFSILDGQEDD